MKQVFKTQTFFCFFITLITFIVFFDTLFCEFLNWDDPKTIYQNESIHSLSLENIKHIFSNKYWSHYQPITYLSLAVEYYFFDLNPFYYHLDNLLIHILNSLLCFFLLNILLKGKNKSFISLLIALLFALHPQKVESVTWAAERKDVLYSFFYLITSIFYVTYINKSHIKFYFFSLTAFILALLSKSMAVSFTLGMIGFDIVMHRKFQAKLILEKLIFFSIAFIFGVISTKINGSSENLVNTHYFSFFERLINASYAFTWYVQKIIIPYNLCAFIPFYEPGYFKVMYPGLLEILIFAGLGFYVIFFRKNRFMWFGLIFFISNLLFTFQIIPFGRVLVADRYTYLSSIGLWVFIMSPMMDEHLLFKIKPQNFKILSYSVFSFLIGIYAFQTTQRISIWKNSEIFWSDVIEKYPSSTAFNKRGEFYAENKQMDLAQVDFRMAYQLNPGDFEILRNLGNIQLVKGSIPEAISFYKKSLQIFNNQPVVYNNLGIAFTKQNSLQQAEEHFYTAIKLDSSYAEAYYNLGKLKRITNHLEEAIYLYKKAIFINPVYFDAYLNLANAYREIHQFNEAEKYYSDLIKINPEYASAYKERGKLFLEIGDTNRACIDFLKINYPETYLYCR